MKRLLILVTALVAISCGRIHNPVGVIAKIEKSGIYDRQVKATIMFVATNDEIVEMDFMVSDTCKLGQTIILTGKK